MIKAEQKSALKTIRKNKFLLLLVSLTITLCSGPLLSQLGSVGAGLQFACLTAVFLSGALANRHRKAMYYTGLAVAVVAIPIMWSSLFVASYQISLGRVLVAGLFCLMTAIMILVSVFSEYHRNSQAIFGGICAYLLLGLAWAMLYAGIELYDPNAFRYASDAILNDSGVSGFPQLVYMSFVTMSTLGYGDISPRTPLAQIATWLQAVVGQFYFAVLIAYLVSALPTKGQDKMKRDD